VFEVLEQLLQTDAAGRADVVQLRGARVYGARVKSLRTVAMAAAILVARAYSCAGVTAYACQSLRGTLGADLRSQSHGCRVRGLIGSWRV
jgi:hypothetical protein